MASFSGGSFSGAVGGFSVDGGVAPVVPGGAPFGVFPHQPQKRFAKLRAFEQPDEYGLLIAELGQVPLQSAVLRAFEERELFGHLSAVSVFHANIKAVSEDAYTAPRGKRGLPSYALLALFLSELNE